MPFLLFLLSVATLVAVSSRSDAKGRGGRTQTFTLDANMPDALRNQVLAALVSGADPATLDAFAMAIQAQYPLSAGLLHAKATSLRGGLSGPAALPAAPIDPGGPQLDPSMPPPLVAFVHSELANESDAARLLALANTIAAQYPIASSLLTQRAAVLNVQPAQPSPIIVPPAPQPSPGVPSAPALNIPGLDAGMPAGLAQAVMTALANENDPTKLQADAQEIQGPYPLAANLLIAKANGILALQQPLPTLPVTPAPVPTPATPSVSSQYAVRDGDYPWKIAAKYTGHGARWPELVAANPQKPRAKDGNFASLLPGEKLSLPGSWVTPAAPSTLPRELPAPPDLSATTLPVIAPAPPVPTPGLDANIPTDVASAVSNALQTGTDPNQVLGFATAIAPRYPAAASLLHAKAASLAIPTSSTAPAATYRVKPGDSPSKIAAALVHNGNRWQELVAANPRKKLSPNGNFASLVPGELLQLPPSWTTAPAQGGA